jgi:hypothetical protein
MTILTLSRALEVKGKDKEKLVPDYDSIIKPGRITKIIPTVFIKEFVKKNKLKREIKFDLNSNYVSNKSGPIGKATLTAMSSLFSYTYPLMSMIYKITNEAGINFFNSSYTYIFNNNIHSKDENPLGKLSLIYDPEGKVRIVAIVDYYTQLFLKPIHNELMNCLYSLKNDRTKTQDPRNKWEENDESF